MEELLNFLVYLTIFILILFLAMILTNKSKNVTPNIEGFKKKDKKDKKLSQEEVLE